MLSFTLITFGTAVFTVAFFAVYAGLVTEIVSPVVGCVLLLQLLMAIAASKAAIIKTCLFILVVWAILPTS